jgi:putative membrane protein
VSTLLTALTLSWHPTGYGPGWIWMMIMPLVWIGLIAVIAWAVIKLVQRPGDRPPDQQHRETRQEILDRRFASGEIDADTYAQARARLADREPRSS